MQVFADETPEQTRKILNTTASRYLDEPRPDHTGIIERHHEFQRSLEKVKVVIPFADFLAEKLPVEKLEAASSL